MIEKNPSRINSVALADSQMEAAAIGGNKVRGFSPQGRETARKISDIVAWPFRQVKSFVTGLFS